MLVRSLLYLLGMILLVPCTARPTEERDALAQGHNAAMDLRGGPDSISHTLLNASDNMALSDFTKRQCVWNKDLQGWQCDSKMPMLIQLITRMREGKGTVDRSVAFYTNLGDPALQPNKNNHEAWLCAWFKAMNKENSYYWWAAALDNPCEYSTRSGISPGRGLESLILARA